MAKQDDVDLQQQGNASRRFNRFYTRAIGTLHAHLLGSVFTLAEARVLCEISRNERSTATQIAGNLDLDGGYLSRILAGFAKKRLITHEASSKDARESFLSLTSRGKKEFSSIDEKAASQAIALLKPLAAADRQKIVSGMSTIESILSVEQTKSASTPPFILRPHRPGDIGWVVQRHGTRYAQEYGWDERERCWIAERNDETVGCVFLVKHPDSPETMAKLRLLLVEPSARGFGIGKRLVRECTLFACAAGYRKIDLWTNSVLDAARHLYQEEGYKLIKQEAHQSFGKSLVGETWELAL